MKRFLLTLIFLSSLLTSFGQIQAIESELEKKTCLSVEEFKLYQLINEYRSQKKLKDIPLSLALTTVAQAHAKDLSLNYHPNDKCNLHSWSASDLWSACCYTPDHKRAQCMWDKPRELTDYVGDGYEIAFYSTFPEEINHLADSALDRWKKSKGHNQVIINLKQFKEAQWNAIGVGIYNGYVCVWFGMDIDVNPSPQICE